MPPTACYHPDLAHNHCPGGHPIHYDNSGRYPRPEWVHCLIVDVVQCPWEMVELDPAAAAQGYEGTHRRTM